MATDAQERAGHVDAERVAAMRAMLSEPGGEAEIAKRYGEAALQSDELATARSQQRAATARQREQRERIARAQQAKAEQRQQAQQNANQAREAKSPEQLRATLREGRTEVNKTGQQAAKAREQARESALSR